MEEILAKIVHHLTKTQFDDLPATVIDHTKKFIVDSFGVAIAGGSAPGCKEVADLVRSWGGKPEATLLGYEGKVPSPSAAFANSVMMHALDFDDTLDESALHAHVTVLPSALAVAEAMGGVSGKDLITAVTLGVDLVCRLGLATRRPLSWVRTATCGSFGAAAASGKILRLDKEEMWNALGVVYSQASGNAQCLIDGGLVKRMQPGFSAKAGVFSVFLAKKGITGAKDLFEGPYGFFNLYEGGDYDRESILTGFGKQFEGVKLSIKPYPSCRMTHASIDAAIAVRENYKINPSEIEEVVVRVSPMVFNMVGSPFVIRENPQVDAQFSIPYNVAVGMIKGEVFLKDFDERYIRDPQVLELSRKIRVEIDPGLPERDMMSADLQVKTKNNIFYKKVDKVKGNPLNPMDMNECVKKFMKCIEYSENPNMEKKAKEILDALIDLDQLRDISVLMRLFV
ncbi:MAG: MmgE/PrpD family protein [Syntrophaceae bacterium]|nr:MmgE/PrpD family protein [Syntrophaceae bacterium]